MLIIPNIHPKDDSTVIYVDLPGIDPKEVKVHFAETVLYLNDMPVCVSLKPTLYDVSAITANLKHGLLKITVPRKKTVRVEIPVSVG